MHIGRGGIGRVNQVEIFVHPYVDFHPVVPLVAFFGLVHLWIPITDFCLLVELGAAIKVASTIAGRRMIMP